MKNLSPKQKAILISCLVPDLDESEQKRFTEDLVYCMDKYPNNWLHMLHGRWDCNIPGNAVGNMANKIDEALSSLAALIKKYEIKPPHEQLYAIYDHDRNVYCVNFQGEQSTWLDAEGEIYANNQAIFENYGTNYHPNMTSPDQAQNALRYFVKEAAEQEGTTDHEVSTSFEAFPCEIHGEYIFVKTCSVDTIQWKSVQEEQEQLQL